MLIFGISIVHDNVVVGVLRLGEEEWDIYRYPPHNYHHEEEEEEEEDHKFSDCNHVLYNGLCYCLCNEGHVRVFDPK